MKSHLLRLVQTTLTAAVLLFAAASACAHPGHGVHEVSVFHILSSPYHLAVLVLGGVLLLLAGRFVQRRLPRRVLQCAGVAALAAATLLWGVHT